MLIFLKSHKGGCDKEPYGEYECRHYSVGEVAAEGIGNKAHNGGSRGTANVSRKSQEGEGGGGGVWHPRFGGGRR